MSDFLAALAIIIGLALGIWFGLGAMVAGEYRTVEGVGGGCYVATDYTVPWYNMLTNTITSEEVVCE